MTFFLQVLTFQNPFLVIQQIRSKNMHRKIFYFLLFLALCPVLINAGTKGRIKGKVTDLQTGEALIGANVVVVGTSAGANTDASGEFLIQNLEAGVYTIKASYVGYQTLSISNIRVNADLTAYQDIHLSSTDIEIKTQTIIAQRPMIQKDNTNAVRITTNEDIQSLPIRSVTNIIGLTAGVVIQNNTIYIRGGRGDEVGYYLEGVSVRNPLTNRNAVTISQDAIEEIQVQAGGYTAEFGGANAGIVRQQLKSGGQDLKASLEYITDNIGFKSGANAYDGKKVLGAYWWGYQEASGVVSGSITEKAKFFLNVGYTYNKDSNPQNWPGLNFGTLVSQTAPYDTIKNLVYPAGPRKGVQSHYLTFTGTLNYDLKPVLLRFTGSFTSTSGDLGGGWGAGTSDLGTATSYLNTRLGQQDLTNGAFSVKLTHVINPNLFYEVSAGYYVRTATGYDRALGSDYWSYGDSLVNAQYGWTIPRAPYDIAHYSSQNFGRYKTPRQLIYDDYFTFAQNGQVTAGYSKSDQRSLSLNGALTLLLGKTHTIKLGGEYQQYTLRSFAAPTATTLAQSLDTQLRDPANAGKSVDQVKAEILTSRGVNNYGYDVFGNQYDGTGFDAPHKPVFASAYIQDKIEFDDLILNLGLRYDHFDIDNLVYKDPATPELAINKANTVLDPNGYVSAAPFDALSPRIGLSFPVTQNIVFHAQYGKFIQQPQLGDIYEGYYSFAQKIRSGGNYYPTVTGPNLRPERTTQYEIGFTQQLTDFLSFDITGFYRDVRDQVIYSKQLLNPGSTYGSEYFLLANGDFATTKGVEIQVTLRRFSRLQINANLSFQDAEGTGSNSNDNSAIVFQPVANTVYTPKVVTPLKMNRPLTGNLAIDYRWGVNDGPKILENFGISALLTFNSGHPYTLGYGNNTAEQDQRNRYPLEALNASLTPSVFQVDLRVDKTISLFDKLSLNIYVYVINLFDTQNVNNVFLKTGTATDNGNVNTQAFQENLAKYGQSYLDLYQALNFGYQFGYGGNGLGGTDNLYGTPRQIRLGVRLGY